jgi:hypothetical protein
MGRVTSEAIWALDAETMKKQLSAPLADRRSEEEEEGLRIH